MSILKAVATRTGGDTIQYTSTMASCTESQEPSGITQDIEINQLKEVYGNRCRIIQNIGDFANVVTITREGSSLTLKFQLEGNIVLMDIKESFD